MPPTGEANFLIKEPVPDVSPDETNTIGIRVDRDAISISLGRYSYTYDQPRELNAGIVGFGLLANDDGKSGETSFDNLRISSST
jgi:hypothetical protein